MKTPSLENRNEILPWSEKTFSSWERLHHKINEGYAKANGGDAFRKQFEMLRRMAASENFSGLDRQLPKRVTARALTQLWLEAHMPYKPLLMTKHLHQLEQAQQPRLGRLPLINLICLYIGQFDELNKSFRDTLEITLQRQLERVNIGSSTVNESVLTSLQRCSWLLTLDGPRLLVEKALENNQTLHQALEYFHLDQINIGRYGEICLAHYYVDMLYRIPLGEHDEILDELSDRRINRASYGGMGRCIGHQAIEILLDRCSDGISDAWQEFILGIAGDPRIASDSRSYQQWWMPLGEKYTEQMRGYLSKEDLRLFLQALEIYGNQPGNEDIQRMFPARKTFLEGLYQQNRIRSTRLMLGWMAESSIKSILKDELQTSYVKLSGSGLNDKALIYLDCGDFFLLEGSHSFKLWAYLQPPNPRLTSYNVTRLSFDELTKRTPAIYQERHPNLTYKSVRHHPNIVWQNKVISFITDNGIDVDIESLFTTQDYKDYVERYGFPVVSIK